MPSASEFVAVTGAALANGGAQLSKKEARISATRFVRKLGFIAEFYYS